MKGVFQDAHHRFDSLKIGLKGAYQEENAAVALEAFLLFMEQRGLAVDETVFGRLCKRLAGRVVWRTLAKASI